MRTQVTKAKVRDEPIRSQPVDQYPLMLQQMPKGTVIVEPSRVVIWWEGLYREARSKEVSLSDARGVEVRQPESEVPFTRSLSIIYEIERPNLEDEWVVGSPKWACSYVKHWMLWVRIEVQGGELQNETNTAVVTEKERP